MNSEQVKLEIQRRIEEGRKKMLDEVAVQLEKEKEAALAEARQKEVSSFHGLTILIKLLEKKEKRDLLSVG